MEVSDGYIVKDDVKVLESHLKTLFDALTDLLSLGDELVSVVAGHHRLQNLIDNGWQYSTVVVKSQISVDCE